MAKFNRQSRGGAGLAARKVFRVEGLDAAAALARIAIAIKSP
jgi:hypothetical protein